MFANSKDLIKKKFRSCCVFGCTSNNKENPEISLHSFPVPNGQFVYVEDYFGNQKQVDRLTAWKNILKIKQVTGYMRICSMHFTKNDYLFPDVPVKQRKLKKSAIPSVKLPYTNEKSVKKNNDRIKRRLGRENSLRATSVDQTPKENMFAAEEPLNIQFEDSCNISSVGENLNYELQSSDIEDFTMEQAWQCVSDLVCICRKEGILNKENKLIENYVQKNEDNQNEKTQENILNQDFILNESVDNPVEQLTLESKTNFNDQEKAGVDYTKIKLKPEDFGVQVNLHVYKFFNLITNKEQLSTATGLNHLKF